MSGIIVDIDGTLLNGDTPKPSVIKYITDKSKNYTIYIITGRYETIRQETVQDLRSAGIKYDRLYMSKPDEGSISSKRRHANRILQSTNIVLAIENNENTRKMYRSLGIRAVGPDSLPRSESLGKMSNNFFDGLFDK